MAMTRPAIQQAPTGPRLSREAVLLRELYKAYLSDRDFLRDRPDAKILVFLDSHEIKAYIDPDAPGSLAGFIMHLENEFGGTQRRTVVSLRHDQILNGMLFDPARVCGILPSHGEEMDREVAFRSHHWLDTVLKLVRQAQLEIRQNRTQAERFAAVVRNEKPENQSELEADLVRFFQTHAPALTAILRDTLFSPHQRLQAILDDSRLTLFEDIRWADFGVPAEVARRLQELEPSPEQTLQVRSRLSAFDYRKNTVEANLIDSAALAHMQLLREELDRGGAKHLRVVLVSRARTLLRAAADLAAQSHSELLVRHPRMLALTTRDAIKVDEAAKLTLGTALDVWQSQLRDHLKSKPDEDGNLAPLKQPATAFLDTWDTFEGSRLAIEAKWRQGTPKSEKPTDVGELAGTLFKLFCSNDNPEEVLNQTLIERFTEFSNASGRFLLEPKQLALRARLAKVPGDRVYISPVAAGAVGPIQVADWTGSPESGQALSLEEIAKRVRRAERPLVWSLALACAGRWKQAAIFARSALQLAELEGRHEIQDDAWLLRAEIRRLGALARPPADPDDEHGDAAERYARSMKELERVKPANARRRLREEAAQLLEVALSNMTVADLPAQLRHYFNELDRAAELSGHDESKARYIALMLMLYLFDVRRIGEESALRPSERDRAASRHGDLVALLHRLQRSDQTDAIPHRARAMEVIGYRLFETTPPGHALGDAPIKPRSSNVPLDLRGELPDLLKGLEASSDKVAAFLKDEIEAIEKALRPFHNPELLLAPLAAQPGALDLLRRFPQMERKVQRALQTNQAAGLALLGTNPEPADEPAIEEAIKDFQDAVAHGRDHNFGPMPMFYLRSALLYAKLLDATLEPRYLRRPRFEALIAEYKELCRDYPDAALPYIRLAYLAEKTEQQDLEQEAVDAALARVDDDQYYPAGHGGPHWLQSFIRRRHALIILRDWPDATKHWSGEPGSAETSGEVVALIEACRYLVEADRRDVAREIDKAHRIERERRINNIVFYGSRLIERTGSRDAFNSLSSDKSLADFVERLAPDQIDGMDDLDMVHTVGCYYAAVGDSAEAQRAAQRIYGLMSAGKQITGPDATESYDEAHTWFKAGKQPELTAA
jgi:tetratricopeptide (TPR) repeat protein